MFDVTSPPSTPLQLRLPVAYEAMPGDIADCTMPNGFLKKMEFLDHI